MKGFTVCIPARYGSTRLPGKPLRKIAGKELILWAVESAAALQPDDLVVATDDERIQVCVEKAGHQAVMTSSEHATGTDRLAECAEIMQWKDEVIVLNYQGDEPMIPRMNLQIVIEALQNNKEASIATLYQPIETVEQLLNPNVVKVVTDKFSRALYFSRAPIPWQQGQKALDAEQWQLGLDMPYKRHVGLYAYTVAFLREFGSHDMDAVEQLESLEQLRALRMGHQIMAMPAAQPMPPGIDTEDDLKAFAAQLK
ncbi:3-deoxy-manno-octulosonate cytidylyltransferase [Marinicella sp. W31]|uniref:3-deoxy-manno-octulosonate cytidylyltransferase n=1 Tax=Marinicella sp. W31 TaxID=3023713 RepID=UPI003757F728